MTGVLVGTTPAAGGSGYASFRLPHGAAPTTNITNGDVWSTTAGLFARINGATATLAFTDSTMTGNVTPAATPAITAIGYLGSPVNPVSSAYPIVMTDAGKTVDLSSATGAVIPANASIAFPVGTVIWITNYGGGVNVTIGITSDTLQWIHGGARSTGTRTMASYGWARLQKIASTTWSMFGDGIT